MELSMIDINKELKRMAKEFGLTEKEVATNWRNAVRSAWGDSIFKRDFYTKRAVKIKNTNTRSMKRFPTVTKYECAICKGMFSVRETELDHLVDENKMTDLSHANDFMKAIFFTSPDKLQILCKDKKRKVKGKNVVTHFGCHSVKTYSQRYGVTFNEALLSKQIINLCKDDSKVIEKLLELGVLKDDLPKYKKGRNELLDKLMRDK